LWVGPEQDIRELERLLKIQLRSKIAGNKRGFTEWVTDITLNKLCDITTET
jgi:ribosome-binding protein aMBF1 (putative translation factor)